MKMAMDREVEAMADKKSVFETLNDINVNDHVEKKGKLSYLSWAWAWGITKKYYPEATYKIYETDSGMFYFTDGRTAWVKTGVTINGIENVEYLPVMDNYNRSIPLDKITSFNVNTAIQRSLTKAIARHGLGLYIYAGEDLPDAEQESAAEAKATEDINNALISQKDIDALKVKLSKAGKAPAEVEALKGCKNYESITFRQFNAAMRDLSAE